MVLSARACGPPPPSAQHFPSRGHRAPSQGKTTLWGPHFPSAHVSLELPDVKVRIRGAFCATRGGHFWMRCNTRRSWLSVPFRSDEENTPAGPLAATADGSQQHPIAASRFPITRRAGGDD